VSNMENSNKPFRITIKRSNVVQLETAIEDLIKRGFHLIKRGITENEVACYSTTNKKHSKYDFNGTTKYNRAWAILER